MFARSRRRTSILLPLLAILALTAGAPISAQQSSIDASNQARSNSSDATFRSSPVMFIQNAGQWPDAARFQVWGGTTGTMWLAEDAIWVTVVERTPVAVSRADKQREHDPATLNLQPSDMPPTRGVNIKLSFVDANSHPRIEPFDRLDTVVSYFIGNEPDQWRPDVPVWDGVRYVDLYPGVDLELTSEGGQMVQRLDAQPGADLSAVRLRVGGADVVTVEGDMLRLSTAAGEVAWPLLLAKGTGGDGEVQLRSGQVFDIATPFKLTEANPGSAVANPQSVTDNPAELLYSTYLGGSNGDYASSVTVDGAGCAYVTGYTSSTGFPTTSGAFDGTFDSSEDAFVVKSCARNSTLAYATFLGGGYYDQAMSIAVNGDGQAFVTGWTNSWNFPTTPGAYDTTTDGHWHDAFVTRLNAVGSALVYSTFLGGSNHDESWSIALDGSNQTYISGRTLSSDFPTSAGAFDRTYNGGYGDGFVAKLNSAGTRIVYATFLGGSGSDTGVAIAVDEVGGAYMTGRTDSANFPSTPSAFDRSLNANGDGFVIKLNGSGSALLFSTFLGGSGSDTGVAIAVDMAGSAYVAGDTGSSDFPTTQGALDRTCDGDSDGFVARLNETGSGLVYSTFLGGNGSDESEGIAVDGMGSAYVIGGTNSANFPTTEGAFDQEFNGGDCYGSPCYDTFVVKLSNAGGALLYGTFVGGDGSENGGGIALDATGRVYIAGRTSSIDFPTTSNAFDRSYSGGEYGADAFVAKLAMAAAPTYTISGRVTDASGFTGIPGVTVWAGFPLNTTTDANGNYTFTGLSAGTYTITPDKEPCTFAPATQTVTVPPGKALPDFRSVRLESGLDICVLEPGDILLKAGAPVGDYTDLIRFWIKLGGSYFTHSALYVGVTSDPQNPAQTGPRIAEAAGKKKLGGSRDDEVWETWLADTQWWDGENVTDWAVVRPVASSEAKAIAIQYARDKAADPNVIFSFLTDLDDEQEFYCSKLVWKSYQHAGVDVHKKTGLMGDLTSNWVTPEDLYFGSPVVQNMPDVDPSTRAFFRIYSPAHITLIDPLGRRTGFDSTSGGEVNEIPGAMYSGADAQIESITVAGLGSSEGWRLLATGYASGTYTLETGFLDGRTRNWETRATTSEGKIDEYPVRPPNYPSYLPLLLR